MVTRQPQVARRTAKVRLSETDVLPLSHETNSDTYRWVVYHVMWLFTSHLSLVLIAQRDGQVEFTGQLVQTRMIYPSAGGYRVQYNLESAQRLH